MGTLFIEHGSPWENGYVESFNGKLRDELLNREIFYTLREAKILVERWRREYGGLRIDQAKRLKELERKNSRLKKLARGNS